MSSLQSYLLLSALLFSIGFVGAVTRRNAILVLVGIELMLNAANLNFIATARTQKRFRGFCSRFSQSAWRRRRRAWDSP